MNKADYEVERSRATAPLFFRAPHPPLLTPREYQFAGVEYALARNHALIGDQPGIGKTAQGILISNALEAKRTLVICPASLRLNWEREIWQWSMTPNVRTYPALKASMGIPDDRDFVIVSYDLLRNPNILGAILASHWDHCILDEAHAIKDPKGNKRMRAICAPDLLPSVVGRFTLLSGTILPNQPIECLGAETLVCTDRGWLPIVQVQVDDLLWDGLEWVRHTGLVYRGTKQTLNVAGVNVTAEHNVNVNNSWRAAGDLASREALLSQALETGSANLPSWVLTEAREAGSWASVFNATAGASRSQDILRTSATAELPAAGLAELRRERPATRNTADMLRSAQTESSAAAFSTSSATSFRDATTRSTPHGNTMEGVGSRYALSGAKEGSLTAPSWPISSPFPGGISRAWSWIGGTTREVMSRAISGLLPSPQTRPTSGTSSISSDRSTFSRPVYDLTNAGPRHRFTILTERGPLIVHNCYNAVRLLDWGAIDCMSLEDFREYYYDVGEGMVRSPVWDPELQANVTKLHFSDKVRNKPRNLGELQHRLRSRIMVRRVKSQVLTELPPKQYQFVPLSQTADAKAALKHPGWAAASTLYEADPDSFAGNIPIDGAVSSARRLLGEAKAPAVCAYIDDLLESGVEKVVVAAHHTSVLKYAREKLAKHGLVYMDGGTPMAKRRDAVDAFNGDPRVRVILGQTGVIGEGHTLAVAQDVVAMEPDWVPGKIEQLADRVHRIGQTGSYVLVHLPVYPGTLDERVLNVAIAKDQAIHLALDAA